MPADDDDLREKVQTGHHYIVLRDDIPDEDLAFVSEYLNSDQNQNQCTSEMSTLAQVLSAVEQELKNTPHPKVSAIVQAVAQASLVKQRPDNVGDMAHYVTNLIGTGYVNELMSWHSRHVNPKDMSITPRWLGDTAKTLGKESPLMLLAFTFVQYRGEVKLEQARPLPDVSRAVGLPELTSLVKDRTNLRMAEEMVRDNRKLLANELEKLLGSNIKATTLTSHASDRKSV